MSEPRPPSRRRPFALLRVALVGALWLAARGAGATPRPLPFTYPAETIPAGALEVEQYADLVAVRVAREEAGETNAVTSIRSELQTELEYGITDRLELGFYFAFQQAASATSPYLQFRGVKQRLRYNLTQRPCWPLGVGLYAEVAEFHDELEFEQRILLSRRFGPLGLGMNLWVEQEYYFQDDDWKFIFNPTLGGYYEFSPHFSLGAEYWVRGRFDEQEPATASGVDAGTTTRHYAGPTAMLQAGEYFVSAGTYLRLDNLAQKTVIGDAAGRVWVRLLIGISL